MCIRSSGCWTQTCRRRSPRVSPEAARSILHGADAQSRSAGFQIQIRVPSEDLPRESEVEKAIKSHFVAEAADAGRELRETMRRGWQGLLLALLVVASLVFFSDWLKVLGTGRFNTYLGESLIIIGWVTLWSPAQLLVFDHFPIRRRRNLARALPRSRVVLETR